MSPNTRPAVWAPISVGTMRHILEQVKGPRDIPEDVLRQAAQGFLAPQPGTVHFATQRRTVGQTNLILMTLSAMKVNGGGLNTEGIMHLGFVLAGAITLTPRLGDPALLGPGSACAITDWRLFEAESAPGTRALHILLPEARLADRGVRVHPSRFKLEGARSLRAPLRGFGLAIADPAWSASAVGESVAERTIEDLVVGMFLESDGYAMDSEDLRAGLRGRALSEIAASHRIPGLNPSLVAERLAVSLRHLQRAFEDSGSSIAGAITHRRAETAALLLTAPGAASLTIDEIAKRSGFSSAFELRAAFRAQYGVLPSQYRENSGALGSYVPQQG